jgi:hypothetical protein
VAIANLSGAWSFTPEPAGDPPGVDAELAPVPDVVAGVNSTSPLREQAPSTIDNDSRAAVETSLPADMGGD